MDCGIPFCQSHDGCPLGNIIPKWNDLVFQVRIRSVSSFKDILAFSDENQRVIISPNLFVVLAVKWPLDTARKIQVTVEISSSCLIKVHCISYGEIKFSIRLYLVFVNTDLVVNIFEPKFCLCKSIAFSVIVRIEA